MWKNWCYVWRYFSDMILYGSSDMIILVPICVLYSPTLQIKKKSNHINNITRCIMKEWSTQTSVILEPNHMTVDLFCSTKLIIIHVFYCLSCPFGPWNLVKRWVSLKKNNHLFPQSWSLFCRWEVFQTMTNCVYSAQVTAPASQSPTVKTIQSPLWSCKAISWEDTQQSGFQICLSGFFF